MKNLLHKYDVPVPRYTSYPTVPNWKTKEFSKNLYLKRLGEGFKEANAEGLSLYIHLPYCESLCTYCGCNTRITVNHAVEQPYVEAVLKEWALMRNYFSEKPRIKEIHLGGGTPTFFSPQNLQKLVKGLLLDSDITPDSSFGFEAHPANTTQEHLEVLRALGFDRLSLGIQDFDPKVQKAINRRQTFEDVQRVVDSARTLGYRSINFDLIYGLPFQTPEGVQYAVEKVVEMGPDRIAFYSYAHVPWMKPGQRAYSEADLPKGIEKLKLFELGRASLLDAGYKAIGFDHFALKSDRLYKAFADKTMHRNFMGFSELRTRFQIGLGVSSISDIGNAFAQNTKTVESYLEAVQKAELPIFQGHIHNVMDVVIRKHVLNLTCKQATSWKDAPLCEKVYMRACLGNLDHLLEDGFIELGDDEIKVTLKGALFVRHVCAAFDRDMQVETSAKRYSQGV